MTMTEPCKVRVAREGKFYTGTYSVEGEAVFVEYEGQSRTALLEGLSAEERARMTLGEMVAAPPTADGHGRRPGADH